MPSFPIIALAAKAPRLRSRLTSTLGFTAPRYAVSTYDFMPTSVHIVQGGVANGDSKWLLRASGTQRKSGPWIVPKSANPGDLVIVYIGGYGFFATGIVASNPSLRADVERRYGSAIKGIELIRPPISLAAIHKHLPELKWAKYPRSITTLEPSTATRLLRLVDRRRATNAPDLNEASLREASICELRAAALAKSRPKIAPAMRARLERARATAIRLYALARAEGVCEACQAKAPFLTPDRTPYLEVHHIDRVADGGPDHPSGVISLCPNCHTRAHRAADSQKFNETLRRRVRTLEERFGEA